MGQLTKVFFFFFLLLRFLGKSIFENLGEYGLHVYFDFSNSNTKKGYLLIKVSEKVFFQI